MILLNYSRKSLSVPKFCLPFMPDQGVAVNVRLFDDLTVTYCSV